MRKQNCINSCYCREHCPFKNGLMKQISNLTIIAPDSLVNMLWTEKFRVVYSRNYTINQCCTHAKVNAIAILHQIVFSISGRLFSCVIVLLVSLIFFLPNQQQKIKWKFYWLMNLLVSPIFFSRISHFFYTTYILYTNMIKYHYQS